MFSQDFLGAYLVDSLGLLGGITFKLVFPAWTEQYSVLLVRYLNVKNSLGALVSQKMLKVTSILFHLLISSDFHVKTYIWNWYGKYYDWNL